MEAIGKRQPIALYEVPLLPELEVKSLIIKALPQAQLALQNIILRKKDSKFHAFLMVPASKVDSICVQKTLIINKESVTIKKPFTEAQVFIGRIPETLTIDEIRASIEGEFGKIINIQVGQPFEQTKSNLRHCYIQFATEESAEKCVLSPKKILLKGIELKPSRAYTIQECDETDKKLFLKIISQVEDQEDLEAVLNAEFQKQGKMREKVRVDNGKAVIIYTSGPVADKVLHNFKGGKIGKYEVSLRPYANRDNYTVFVGGLQSTVTAEDLQAAFKNYQPLISSNILFGNNPNVRNGTITFGDKGTYSRLLVEYKDDPAIRWLFQKNPYVTQHMSAKDRNEYNQFKKGKVDKRQTGPIIPPTHFPMFAMQQQPQQPRPFGYNTPPSQPMGNFGLPNHNMQ